MLTFKELREEVESGNRAALPAAILMKRMMEDIEADYAAVRELAKREHQDKYGSAEVVIDGATITRSASGRYTYDHIGGWTIAKKNLTAIEKRAQEAYKVARDGGKQLEDKETGELIQPAFYKPNDETIAIKI